MSQPLPGYNDGHTQVLRGILRRPSGGVSYYKANTFIKAEIYAEPGESDDRNTSTDDRPSNVDYEEKHGPVSPTPAFDFLPPTSITTAPLIQKSKFINTLRLKATGIRSRLKKTLASPESTTTPTADPSRTPEPTIVVSHRKVDFSEDVKTPWPQPTEASQIKYTSTDRDDILNRIISSPHSSGRSIEHANAS